MKILDTLRDRWPLGLVRHRVPTPLTRVHLESSDPDSLPQHARCDPHTIATTIENALSAAGLMADTVSRAECNPAPSSIPGLDALRPRSAPPAGPPNADTTLPGQFLSRSFTNTHGTRAYKLYIPASVAENSAKSAALIVMLHGCTQSPDDFAAGTRMNELAERDGFLVAYPAQTAKANGSKCWNWFRSGDQERERGEPSLIAGMTREIATHYAIDDRRIFVAGLSAGAAMAVILGATYPDLYAAVGAHSGLPYGAAHDVPSAFSAMKGSDASPGLPEPQRSMHAAQPAVPTIVFHGDCDTTVNISNSNAIVERAISWSRAAGVASTTQRGRAAGGNEYSRTIYTRANGRPFVEAWIVHGAAHAWSGGSPRGSFTEIRGPDASEEMIRFFLAQSL